jgi:hypothetical protein
MKVLENHGSKEAEHLGNEIIQVPREAANTQEIPSKWYRAIVRRYEDLET